MRNSQMPAVQSIYNNALPFYLDRADLSTLAEDSDTFAQSFLKKLLEEDEMLLQFDSSNIAIEKIRHIYFESKNLARTIGAKTFGFGYPLMIDTLDGELMVAPLFIWQLTIEPAQTKPNAWVTRFDKNHPILPNHKIAKYIKEKFDIDYTESYAAALKGDGLNEKSLHSFSKELADRFHFEFHQEEGGVLAAPGIDDIGVYTEQGAIHCSGVMGIYPPQNIAASENATKPEDVFFDKGPVEEPDPFVFPFLATDPEQVSAQELAVKNGMSIVEGVDVLGKSQTLLNILMTALMQGKRCLVVSERAPALKRTQDLLSKAGVNQLNFLLTDSINDKEQMLELLKMAQKGMSKDFPLDENDFQYKKNKFIREKQRLDESYSAIRNNVFGSNNWTEMVGLYLQNNKQEGKELLVNHLNKQDFNFTKEEHETINNGITRCNQLFKKVKTLNHPLSNLNDTVFKQVSAEDGRNYVVKQVNLFLEKARKLHHQYINTISNYRENLKKHYEAYMSNINQAYDPLNERLLGYKDQLGNDFLTAGPSAFSIPFFQSKKKKKIIAAQQDIAKLYKRLKKSFQKDPYFDFKFGSAREGMQMDEVINNLKSFRSAYDDWQLKLENLVQEDTIRLNSKTAHPSLGVKEEMSELEYSLDVLLEELNEAKLYQQHLANKNLTIPKRQKYLESIIEQMENTRLYIGDFEMFYQWQAQWLKMGPVGQKVIKALVKVRPKKWNAAFESWYFYNLLENKYNSSLPTSNDAITRYDESWHALKPMLLNYISHIWQKKQEEGVKKLKKKNKAIYQEIFERSFLKKRKSTNTVKTLFADSMEAVSSFLPILFVSANVAKNDLPKSFQFDIVVFDESNRFSIEPSTDIAALGKQIVIIGSNNSNGRESSLLQYALENDVPCEVITNKYEAPIPFLANLNPKENVFHYAQECVVNDLEGRFHEMDATNDSEAQQVIRVLNQIKQTPQRVYPKVGIITFTVEQRDLISSYLLKLKQQNKVGSEKIRHLERNGMGVFFIEELYGQQFDVLVVSCTLGSINLKGKLTKRMALLNTEEGVGHIELLINMPLQKLILLHSFNEEQLHVFSQQKWEKGTWLLSHFIKMAEAAQQENEVKYLEELEIIGKKEDRGESNLHLVSELQEALSDYVDAERMHVQQRWEDVVLALVIDPVKPDGPKLVIHPDGYFADTTYTSGFWEKAHLDKLERSGYKIIPVWSVNWFKDPALETRRLASQIIKEDGGVVKEVEGSSEKIEIDSGKKEAKPKL